MNRSRSISRWVFAAVLFLSPRAAGGEPPVRAPAQDREGHTDAVLSVSVHPDGTRVLSAGADRTLRLWNIETGRLIATWRGHTGPVYSAVFLPDGKRALSGSGDTTVRQWDVQTGRLTATWRAHSGDVYGVSASPDGNYAVSVGQDRTLLIWDLRTAQVQPWAGHRDWILSVAFDPSGNRVLTGSRDQSLRLWHVSGSIIDLAGKTVGKHQNSVLSLAFHPDGSKALSAGADRELKLWNLNLPRVSASWGRQPAPVLAVAFHPAGDRALTGGEDHALRLWDVNQGRVLATWTGHIGPIESVAFHPDGARAVSGSRDGTVRVWDVATGRLLATYGQALHHRAPDPGTDPPRPSKGTPSGAPRTRRDEGGAGCGTMTLAIIIILAVVVGGFKVYQTLERRGLDQALNQAESNRLGATAQVEGALRRLRLVRETWEGEVVFHGMGVLGHTRLEAKLRRPSATLSVRPQDAKSGPRLSGARDVEIGDPSFDPEYLITAKPESFAKEFLTDEIRHCIRELRRLGSGKVHLNLHGTRLHLQVGKLIRDPRLLDWFLSLSEKITDAAAGPHAGTGLEILETAEDAGGECQICGSPMAERIVQCLKCGTLHHEECWKYYRLCSTFGCGEKRFKPWNR